MHFNVLLLLTIALCHSSPCLLFTLSNFDITDVEMNDILLDINVNKAHGPDNISAKMIQLCGTNFLKYNSHWNFSSLRKKDDKQLVNNYRLVSLLPI